MNRLYAFYPSYVACEPVWYYYGSMSDGQNAEEV